MDSKDDRYKQFVGGTAVVAVALCGIAAILAVMGIWLDPRWGITATIPGAMGVILFIIAIGMA